MITTGGIVRPSAVAVLRLIISSNFVGCSTGRPAGLAPFQNLLDKNCRTLIGLSRISTIRHQAPLSTKSPLSNIAGSLFFAARSAIRLLWELKSELDAAARAVRCYLS